VSSQRPGAYSEQTRAPVSSQRPGAYSQQSQSIPASPRSSLTPLPFGALATEPPGAARAGSLPPSAERTAKENAEALWQQAKTLSRREQHEAALRAAHSAVKLGPPSPGREAFLGWLIYQHDGAGPVANSHVWRCLNRALKRDPLCEEALYYKGLVLARTGEAEQAYAHFQRVLMLDPKHGGAEREVRIHEMRRDHERQQSGFLRRFLSTRPGAKSG
jgi:tetratricopeptide (TPR) repeat protein